MLLHHKAKLVLCVDVHVYICLDICCRHIHVCATAEMSISQRVRKRVCAPVGFVLSEMCGLCCLCGDTHRHELSHPHVTESEFEIHIEQPRHQLKNRESTFVPSDAS